jgi:hypothetical protein
VSWFGPVLDALITMTGWAEQLGLESFGDELVPSPGQTGADREPSGLRVDVIEHEVFDGSASNAATPEHLDELCAPSLPMCLDVTT